MEVAAPPGAPMHGSGRHRKPDLILLAEGLICPRGERGTRPRSVGRSVGLGEYYDETGEFGDERIIYEEQNCPDRRAVAGVAAAPLLCIFTLVKLFTLKSRPDLTPSPIIRVRISLSPSTLLFSHVRIKPNNNGEKHNGLLPAALAPYLSCLSLLPTVFFRFQPRALLRSPIAALSLSSVFSLLSSLFSFSHFMILLFISA